jgi:uncharacterized protein (DUF58 family)
VGVAEAERRVRPGLKVPFSTGPTTSRAASTTISRDGSAARSASGWAHGPPTDSLVELLRTLELSINRRLDGVLHGDHRGLTPGHGSEPGESRPYQPGDDVRRIDWNVTARTNETYIREQIADHDLTAWLVVDASASMQFGTVANDKAQTAMAAAACVGFLTARHRNRLGALLVAGPHIHVMPPRSGQNQVRAILSTLGSPPASEGAGRAALGAALDRVGTLARRRGFVAVISDFAGEEWEAPLGRVGVRHDLLAITVDDPRERDIPPIGLVQVVDPATGDVRDVRVTRAVQRRFAKAATERSKHRSSALRRAAAETIALDTDDDWLTSIVRHVERRRFRAVGGGAFRR